MKGDFSRLRFSPHDNFNGILPQQGKVLLDSDGIAQTLIDNDWRKTAARDWVGPVAAVPAAIPNSFDVTAATLSGGVVSLTVDTGHMWADGLLVRLDHAGASSVTRAATWLEPPAVPNSGDATTVAAGVMDAVILEVWQHAVNGYQMPDVLIEPALGGPDTAERLQTSFAFRLARLNAGQTCGSLTFDESGRGQLTASLVPPVTITGDCPVDASGGYSGFEHQLYRIEIANTNSAASEFKWSRTNGSLAGRGNFDPATRNLTITANLAAINSSNQTSFYLEMEAFDAALGFSRVIAGAPATLSSGVLSCSTTLNFGVYPSSAGTVFFRLWDGISPVSAFPLSATPAQLENGILLQFDPDGAGKYYPGDYWTFPVRAQGIPNPQTLIDAKQPQGIVYRRVAIAEITWAAAAGGTFTADMIEDCRTIFPPLSRARGCCTYRVGDGVTSFGDFTSIQAAVEALPYEGGEICLSPGLFHERVLIAGKRDVVIHGCGWQTRVASPAAAAAGTGAVNPFPAVFTIVGSQHIELRSFAIEADDQDAAILIDGNGTSVAANTNARLMAAASTIRTRFVIDVAVTNMVLLAATLPAVLAENVELLKVENNRVAMNDVRSLWPAIFASGREIHIERNWVGIQSAAVDREWLPVTVIDDLKAAEKLAASPDTGTSAYIGAFESELAAIAVGANPGGIQIGGPSTDVYILENEIEGGSRNGITLGSYEVIDANGNGTDQWIGVLVTHEEDDCCTGGLTPPSTNPLGTGTIVAGGLLTNIHIHRNRIRNMGMCGIGPVGFFDLVTTIEIITINGLFISQNSITRTLLRELTPVAAKSNAVIGYGAICVPDVVNLVIRDNNITDFGAQAGAYVCGIFVVHGEMIQISGNTILETRDWTKAIAQPTGGSGMTGGIVIMLGTPPAFNQVLDASLWMTSDALTGTAASSLLNPTYEPGLPALRVEHNVVRVPIRYGLFAIGYGPYKIASNHFGVGGLVRTSGTSLAQTVLILNLGTAIELAVGSNPSWVYKNAHAALTGPAAFRAVSNGTVMFEGNVCQLESRASRQREITSVWITTPDSLIFSNNQTWLDSTTLSCFMDAMLIAGTINVVGNRFQEAEGSVNLSGITVGVVNVTGQNISTYCLIVLGSRFSNNNNLTLIPGAADDICARLTKDLQSGQ